MGVVRNIQIKLDVPEDKHSVLDETFEDVTFATERYDNRTTGSAERIDGRRTSIAKREPRANRSDLEVGRSVSTTDEITAEGRTG